MPVNDLWRQTRNVITGHVFELPLKRHFVHQEIDLALEINVVLEFFHFHIEHGIVSLDGVFAHLDHFPAPPDSACACNECPHMKLNTLEKLYLAMKLKTPSLDVEPELAKKALAPIQRMLEWS